MIIPVCDACHGEEFEQIELTRDAPKPDKRVKVSEYLQEIHSIHSIPLLLVYRSFQWRCKKCGAIYQYVERGGIDPAEYACGELREMEP